MNALLIRGSNRNVIEFDEHPGDNPVSALMTPDDDIEAYDIHP